MSLLKKRRKLKIGKERKRGKGTVGGLTKFDDRSGEFGVGVGEVVGVECEQIDRNHLYKYRIKQKLKI